MRILAAIAAGVTLAAAVPTISHADPYRWCAQYTGRGAARNCGFVSYRQCMASVSGVGGFCERNPFYSGGRYTNGRGRDHYRDRRDWR